jgi:hypothetical protein
MCEYFPSGTTTGISEVKVMKGPPEYHTDFMDGRVHPPDIREEHIVGKVLPGYFGHLLQEQVSF